MTDGGENLSYSDVTNERTVGHVHKVFDGFV
jgi:hypothetical protein